MTEEEYQRRKAEIDKVRKDAMRNLILQTLAENAKYKKGDVLESVNGTTIIVSNIVSNRVLSDYKMPGVAYCGVQLTKKGTPRKDGLTSYIDETQVKQRK